MLLLQDFDFGEPLAPAPVSFSLEAPGWQYVWMLLIALTGLILVVQFYKYKKNAYRREAIQMIDSTQASLSERVKLCNKLLKKVALKSISRTDLSRSSMDMLTLLNDRTSKSLFDQKDLEIMQSVNYGSDLYNENELKDHIERVKYWIKNHKAL